MDFEGRNPIDSDSDGIKQMLGQLFVKAHIDLNELSGLIIGKEGCGGVQQRCWKGLSPLAKFESSQNEKCKIFEGVKCWLGCPNRMQFLDLFDRSSGIIINLNILKNYVYIVGRSQRELLIFFILGLSTLTHVAHESLFFFSVTP